MQKWEYKVIITSYPAADPQPAGPAAKAPGVKSPEADLNAAGELGWEAFQVVNVPRGGSSTLFHYLKRARAERHDVERSLAEMTE